jgi:predicted AlkP superfamily pyrophosphatase or phosphodiesterase
LDITGDAAMTTQFLDEAVDGSAALALLWLGEPDHMQHESPLGSPECRATVASVDARFGEVRAAVGRRHAYGEDVLLIAMSDHGHRTASEVINIDAEFAAAGLKAQREDSDLVAASNGTAALIYLDPRRDDRDRVIGFLRRQPWAGEVVDAVGLPMIGQRATHGADRRRVDALR